MSRNRKRSIWLSQKQKNGVRGIAIESLGLGGWDEERSIEIAEARIRKDFGSVFVQLTIALAIALIRLWIEKRSTNPAFEPSAVFVAGEPGVLPDDDFHAIDESNQTPTLGDWT